MGTIRMFFAVALLLVSAVAPTVTAEPPSPDTFSLRVDTPVDRRSSTDYPGDHAWDLGVREYVVHRSGNGLVIAFRHVDESRQGTLRVGAGEGISMELRRGDEVLKVTWENATLTLLDSEGRSAHFWAEDTRWVGEGEASWQILEEHKSDVELMATIALEDFSVSAAGSESDPRGECSECTQASHSTHSLTIDHSTYSPNIDSPPCDYQNWVRGCAEREVRSAACWDARAEAQQKCTNSACWGCCDWQSEDCDCTCLIGHTFCICCITGFPCQVN
jgi:hypothetical protein